MAKTTKPPEASTGHRVRGGHVDNVTGAVVWTKDSIEKIGTVLDGWTNVLTGLGSRSRDKRTGMAFQGAPRITHQKELLDELYHGDYLVGRIVDLLPQEMYREWIDLTVGGEDGNDPEVASMMLQEMDSLGAQKAFADAEAWARLFGGAVILLGVDDGDKDPREPLNLDGIKSLDWLTVLSRFELEPHEFYENPLEEKFGLPRTYRINSLSDVRSGAAIANDVGSVIHESRLIRFDGVRTSRRKRRENRGWSDSVLERYIQIIRDFQGASGGVMHLLTDFSQAVFKIKGLAKALAADKDGLVLKRLQMLDIARSMVRAIPLDADAEEFTREGAAVAGMSDLYDRMMMLVSAATGYPVTLLFGRSPAGENATGESDIRLFYDFVSSRQETEARPRLEYLLEVMFSAKDGPMRGQQPDSWNFEWVPLFQESSKEQAETRKLIAEADKIYIENGVVSADEVAESRYGGDTYSPETMLDVEAREQQALIEATAEATSPINVVSEENRNDAPNIRAVLDDDSGCSVCAYSAGSICTRFKFVYDDGGVCDDWLKPGLEPVKLKKKPHRDAKGLKLSGSRRRGRNY